MPNVSYISIKMTKQSLQNCIVVKAWPLIQIVSVRRPTGTQMEVQEIILTMIFNTANF